VSEFIEQINGIIAGEFVVEGEVSQYKISQGKWIFFDLKDDKAVVNCFATVFNLSQPLEDGMKIRVLGYPKIHDRSGRFSITVQKVELVGEGSLKKAYLLLKKKLEEEGLFNLERKRAVPELPAKIGVIASRDSAAFGDFVRILNNRWSGVEINLYNVAVQGEQAVSEITEAFNYFNTHDTECDVLVLIRGGGSLEDLAAFNNELVVRAVYGSKIPVVCGVGHERDESLCDFAADRRASTPSNAAEIVVPDKEDFISGLDFSLEHISGSMQNKIMRWRRLVEQNMYTISSVLEAPLQKCRNLLYMFSCTEQTLQATLKKHQAFVLSAQMLFKNVDPKRVLRRGSSVVRTKQGALVKNANQLDIGQEFVVELGQGSVLGEVLDPKNKKKKQGKLL
ncbi:MAG: exodeoxyribonuclease VII large subunit, partial [Candidatus Magasanikbacteria bacterium]|nr:exodeoxyribonuclease VII large subunit [Candidatus Magasanikbacteria bacterium]